jgi:hypothetical protein
VQVEAAKESTMTKPPATPPHSDLDGVHQEARHAPDAARQAGQDAGDLAKARDNSAARPPRRGPEKGADDRS